MPFPNTDWPPALDALQARVDGVDVVFDDDFNYPDRQIRQIQDWLGITGDLIGDGIAAEGPGGLVSPIASGAGNRALTLAARAAFVAGDILSVGDAWNFGYTEKMRLDNAGILWALGGLQLGATTLVDSILDEDTMVSDSATALATQQSIKAYVDIQGQQVFYVGKHGNVGFDGLSDHQAFVTFNQALAAAVLVPPAANDRYAIVCDDYGIYNENIVVPSWVDIYAPNARLTGTVTVDDNSRVVFNEIEVGGALTAVAKVVGGITESWVTAQRIVVGAASRGFMNLAAAGLLSIKARLVAVNGAASFGVGDTTTAQGDLHLDIDEIQLNAANGTAVSRFNAGAITGNVRRISDVGGGAGTSVGINAQGGTVDLSVGQLVATNDVTTAAGAVVSLRVGTRSGTVAGGGTAHIVTADQGSEMRHTIETGQYNYVQLAVPIEDVVGQFTFDASTIATGKLAYLRCMMTPVFAAAGSAYVRIYDVGPAAGPPAAPVEITQNAGPHALVQTVGAPGGVMQFLETASLTVGAGPAVGQIQNSNRMYEVTVYQLSVPADTVHVGTAGLVVR